MHPSVYLTANDKSRNSHRDIGKFIASLFAILIYIQRGRAKDLNGPVVWLCEIRQFATPGYFIHVRCPQVGCPSLYHVEDPLEENLYDFLYFFVI